MGASELGEGHFMNSHVLSNILNCSYVMGSMHMFAINSHLLAVRTHIVVFANLLKVLFSAQGQLLENVAVLVVIYGAKQV